MKYVALIIGRVLVVLDESNLIQVSSKDTSHRDTAQHGPKQQPQQSNLHGFYELKTQGSWAINIVSQMRLLTNLNVHHDYIELSRGSV